MEPILLYGFPLGSSMGLVAALEWLGKPYRLCRVDMLGEMRGPSYARINPRHETPAFITDKGEILTQYLNTAYFGAGAEIRLRPSFFPFTEPSAEVDVGWSMEKGRRVVGGSGRRHVKRADGLVHRTHDREGAEEDEERSRQHHSARHCPAQPRKFSERLMGYTPQRCFIK